MEPLKFFSEMGRARLVRLIFFLLYGCSIFFLGLAAYLGSFHTISVDYSGNVAEAHIGFKCARIDIKKITAVVTLDFSKQGLPAVSIGVCNTSFASSSFCFTLALILQICIAVAFMVQIIIGVRSKFVFIAVIALTGAVLLFTAIALGSLTPNLSAFGSGSIIVDAVINQVANAGVAASRGASFYLLIIAVITLVAQACAAGYGLFLSGKEEGSYSAVSGSGSNR